MKSMSWLRRVPGDLFHLDKKPLIGDAPPFPWAEFSEELGLNLKIKDISITPGELQWRSAEDLFKGLGGQLRGLSFGIVPIEGEIWWVMPEQEILRLIDLLIIKKKTPSQEITDSDFISTFYRFLAIEAIDVFENVQADKKLVVTLMEGEALPSASSLCMDVFVRVDDVTITGRMILSPEFRASWVKRYQQSGVRLNSPVSETLDVIVHLEAGRINLKPSEWKQVAVGDFIILDKCSLDPSEDKGKVLLTIGEIPFFRAKIKQNTLKILEHPLHYEVNTMMDKTPDTPDDDIDTSDSFHFDEEITEESTTEESTTEESSAEESVTEESTTEEHTDTDSGSDIFDVDEEHNEESSAPEEEEGSVETAEKMIQEKQQPGSPMKLEDIPLPVVIEVGRIQLSIKKLLELQPGNMLDLDIHPDASVDMVVHGKRIARAELLKIGDSLGVRILELS